MTLRAGRWGRHCTAPEIWLSGMKNGLILGAWNAGSVIDHCRAPRGQWRDGRRVSVPQGNDEAAVIGIPDKIKGEVAKAFVVLQPEFAMLDDRNEIIRMLKTHVRKEIGPVAVVRSVEFVDALPRSKKQKNGPPGAERPRGRWKLGTGRCVSGPLPCGNDALSGLRM